MTISRNIRRSAKRGRKMGYRLSAVRGGLTQRASVASLRRMMKRTANQVVQRNIETKTSQQSSLDGIQVAHNSFVWLTGNLLNTSQGVGEQDAGVGNRIGDRIKLTGVSLKFMLELNERYSDVTFRILVIKSARGDVPDASTLFNNESGNKMMDTINKERYTVVGQKFVKLTSRNLGLRDTTVEYGSNSGIYASAAEKDANYLTRATTIKKMWIPGEKFASGGFIQYENGGTRQKFFDYHVAVYAYANYSTALTATIPPLPWNVGRVNEFLSKMYYKDA